MAITKKLNAHLNKKRPRLRSTFWKPITCTEIYLPASVSVCDYDVLFCVSVVTYFLDKSYISLCFGFVVIEFVIVIVCFFLVNHIISFWPILWPKTDQNSHKWSFCGHTPPWRLQTGGSVWIKVGSGLGTSRVMWWDHFPGPEWP